MQQLGNKLGKNWHIPLNISANTGSIFTKFSKFTNKLMGLQNWHSFCDHARDVAII